MQSLDAQAETVEQLEKLQNVGPVCRELALNTSSQDDCLCTLVTRR